MIEIELYDAEKPLAVATTNDADDFGGWARLGEALNRGIVGGTATRIEVRADVLLAELEVLREIRQLFSIDITLGNKLRERLKSMASDRRKRDELLNSPATSPSIIAEELQAAGFSRTLKPFQLENLSRVSSLPHGADFSVPGAGKTTVALANFAIQRHRGHVEKMLVVAPLAAFAAWKEDSEACFHAPPKLSVHLGNGNSISTNSDIVVTNYHRLASDYDHLRMWIGSASVQMVLDEAHRMKRGRSGQHGRAALDLAFSAARRDILSGTPTPQGAYDLVALISFLYPGQANQILPPDAFVERLGRTPEVLHDTKDAISRYFVRTCKSDLGLPPTSMEVVSRPMGTIQRAIYDALIGQYRGSFQLGDTSRRNFRKLGRITMYLLEAATNPLLLVAGSDADDLPSIEHEPLPLEGNERLQELLARYSEYETPWKYTEIRKIVEKAEKNGEKVLIWSSFVRNIRHLERLLEPWQPAVVHGGIPPRDGAPASAKLTREDELDRFRHDDNCSVLLANPAACGEGVSLHHWCHHAVYLERTFNAGHFLQSQDRIHRLGLDANINTRFTLLNSEDSIDGTVDARLREKVTALANLMNDPGLVQVALPNDELLDDPDGSSQSLSVEEGDIAAVLNHING